MKIWLDDVREPPDNTWRWHKTPEPLVEALPRIWNDIDAMSLDHDLGEDHLTGYEVVKRIETLVKVDGYVVNFPIRVHSANPVGVQNMRAGIASCMKF